MFSFKEKIFMSLIRKYLRTFPPISKNGNGMIGEIKRLLLLVPMNIIAKGNTESMVIDLLTRLQDEEK